MRAVAAAAAAATAAALLAVAAAATAGALAAWEAYAVGGWEAAWWVTGAQKVDSMGAVALLAAVAVHAVETWAETRAEWEAMARHRRGRGSLRSPSRSSCRGLRR